MSDVKKRPLRNVVCRCGNPMEYKVKEDKGIEFPPTLICTSSGCDRKPVRLKIRKEIKKTGVPMERLKGDEQGT